MVRMTRRNQRLGAGLVAAIALTPARGLAAEPPADHAAQWEGVVGPTPAPPAPPPVVHVPPPVVSREDAARDVLRNDPEVAPRYRHGRGMIIGGAVVLSLGVALLSTAALVAVAEGFGGSETFEVSTTFAITGSLHAIGGAALLGVGIVKRRHAVEDARRRVALGVGSGGLALRF